MSEQPAELIHELLRQIRAEQTAFREAVERRFDALESDMLEVKRTLRGMTYMMATFTGRLEDVETRVDRLTPA
jgi:polyhydroxyalkanoate synthesis regulator phasin